jgi:hypothetical protein
MAQIKKERYSGVIFLSAALREIKDSQYFMKKIGRFLGWIAPRVHLSFEPSSNDITKYNCDQQLRNDPFYEKTLVPGSITIILDAMDELSQLYQTFEVPFLAIQGGMDKSVDLFGSIDLLTESPSKDK